MLKVTEKHNPTILCGKLSKKDFYNFFEQISKNPFQPSFAISPFYYSSFAAFSISFFIFPFAILKKKKKFKLYSHSLNCLFFFTWEGLVNLKWIVFYKVRQVNNYLCCFAFVKCSPLIAYRSLIWLDSILFLLSLPLAKVWNA